MRQKSLAALIGPLEPRRLFAAGGLDTSFGTRGKVASSIPRYDHDDVLLAAQPDGGIIVVGEEQIVRFTAAGQLDQNFGLAGKVPDPALDAPSTIALQADGKPLVGSLMYLDDGNAANGIDRAAARAPDPLPD